MKVYMSGSEKVELMCTLNINCEPDFSPLLLFLFWPWRRGDSEDWRGRHAAVSGSHRRLHHSDKVEQIWGICLLLQRKTLLWKLPASVFSWSSGAERSTEEGGRRFCCPEERHRRRLWDLRVCRFNERTTQKESSWVQTHRPPEGWRLRWVSRLRSQVCVLYRCWQLIPDTSFCSAGPKAGGNKDEGNKDKGNKDEGNKDEGNKDKVSKDEGNKDKVSKDEGNKDKCSAVLLGFSLSLLLVF